MKATTLRCLYAASEVAGFAKTGGLADVAGALPRVLVKRGHEVADLRPKYQRLRTLLTIHNLAYQGLFYHEDLPLIGLPWRLYNDEQLEFYGKINFLKGGIVFADLLNTVSPNYAREIQTRYFGCGLQGVLAARQKRLLA